MILKTIRFIWKKTFWYMILDILDERSYNNTLMYILFEGTD